MNYLRGLAGALREGATGTANVDLSSFITALTGSITPEQILTILASVIGVGMSFVLMWFGVRKAVRLFSSAMAKGKIRV